MKYMKPEIENDGGIVMKYMKPEIEIVMIDLENIVRTSSFGNNGDDLPDIDYNKQQ